MLRPVVIGVALAGLGAAWYAGLPPRARAPVPAPGESASGVRGAIHVHSDRSDGTGSPDEVAAGAARAGLAFVVLTDHGDATREPDPPQYRAGVLCIDAIEISTGGGHVVALDLPSAPYPLAGEPRDVVEDIARLGGFSVAAHPGSERAELRWTGWETPFDGLEWLNGDSEWRDESVWSLARALFTYPARPPEALAMLLDRPDAVLARWDALAGQRRVVAVAAADAHARLGLRSVGEARGNGLALRAPSYEQQFRVFTNTLPGVTLTGDAAADGRAVIDALRAGRVYSTIDAIGGPTSLSFTATSGSESAAGGDVLPLAGPVTLRVDALVPDDTRIDLLKNGARVASQNGNRLEFVTNEPAAYRVEVSLPGGPGRPPVPWILSNPIYVGRPENASPPSDRRPVTATLAVQYDDGPATGWTVEHSDASAAALDVVPAVGGAQLLFRYALGGTASAAPFAALVMPAGAMLPEHDRLVFTARADRPMRLSVQLRTPGGEAGERWHRSVFLDPNPRDISIYFDDLTPRGVAANIRPILSNVDSVLYVVDAVNTKVGGRGRVWIDDVAYGR